MVEFLHWGTPVPMPENPEPHLSSKQPPSSHHVQPGKPTHFRSHATDEASFFQDLAAHKLQEWGAAGIVSPVAIAYAETGMAEIRDAETFLLAMAGWTFAQTGTGPTAPPRNATAGESNKDD
ncbi:MAG: hypothetical protein JO001_22960 [Alphaproteobacteria bacterium]|nr:hypothetical protein [Alphaproteobacteria bacterium]